MGTSVIFRELANAELAEKDHSQSGSSSTQSI